MHPALKKLLLVNGFMGITLFSLVTFFLIPQVFVHASPPIELTPVVAFSKQTISGLPVRLTIPKINVDAAFEHVGLTSAGVLDTPKVPAHVAWFDKSPRPGEKGNSVVDGHYGWKDDIPAVFDALHQLQKGDMVYVVDDAGMTTAFTVRESRIYNENEDVSVLFGIDDGEAHLNLVTCGGVWNSTEKSYSTRLVVFTDKNYE